MNPRCFVQLWVPFQRLTTRGSPQNLRRHLVAPQTVRAAGANAAAVKY